MNAHHQQDSQTGFVPIDAVLARHAAPGQRPVALVPGALVPLIGLDLPAAVQGFQREKIAARQLHDLIELSPEQSEIRPLPDSAHKNGNGTGSWSQVLIADKAQVAGWRQQAAGRCRAMLPDYLALPTARGIFTLQHHDGQILARLGPDHGFSIEPGPAALILARALREAPPQAVLWLGPRQVEFDQMFAAADLVVVDSPEAIEALDLPRPVSLQHGELAGDLLQDPQRERDRLRRLVLPWRWPALLGLLAGGLWAAALMLETGQLQQQTQDLRDDIQQSVRQHFIPEGPILNARVQVENTLQTMRDRVRAQAKHSSPLDLMARAATVLHQSPATVDEMSYANATGTNAGLNTGLNAGLSVILRLKNFTAQDALVQALQQQDLTVEVIESGLSEAGDQVLLELRLGLKEVRP